jgi:hypothetical protein
MCLKIFLNKNVYEHVSSYRVAEVMSNSRYTRLDEQHLKTTAASSQSPQYRSVIWLQKALLIFRLFNLYRMVIEFKTSNSYNMTQIMTSEITYIKNTLQIPICLSQLSS